VAGQMVDATIVAPLKQPNNERERADIKAGKTAGEIWPGKPAKARQKDVDARWTVKVSKAKPATNRASQSRSTSRCPPSATRLVLGLEPEEPCRHRSPAQLHPRLARDQRRGLGRRAASQCAGPRQYRLESLGRHRLLLEDACPGPRSGK